MNSAAAFAIAGVMLMSACVYAQVSLSGRYTGTLLVNSPSHGAQTVGLTLVIDSVEGKFEPPRDSRRLHFLRGWSYEHNKEVFPGSPGAGGAAGI